MSRTAKEATMDANEQGPGPELRAHGTGEAGTSEDGARARREAACRAAHPSGRGRRAEDDTRRTQAAATHYEAAAVRWLAGQCDHLHAWPGADTERAATLRALGDLALLVGVRLRRGTRSLSADYAALLAALSDVAARADTRQLLGQESGALLPLVTVQWALTAHGRPDPCLAQTLAMVLAERSVPGVAPTAQDQVALHFLLRQSGIDLPCPQLPELLTTSVLADDSVALALSRADLWALTSLVVTASDFGADEIPWPAGRSADGVSGILQEGLLLAMADDDPALVAALLTARTCLGEPSGDLPTAARRWLHGWQESDGRTDGTTPTQHDGPEGEAWAAAMRATALTALDGLLLGGTHAARPGSLTVPPVAGRAAVAHDAQPVLVDSVVAAADWLDAVLPATHVPGRVALAEAWLALGDQSEARRQLVRLAEDPHLAFTVLRAAPDQAVHLAALVVALDIASPPLADLCGDVAALLSHPEAAEQLFGADPRPPAGGTAPPGGRGVDAAADEQLRRRTAALCATLLRDGPRSDPRSPEGLQELLQLASATRRAAASGDVGWLALLLRGLHRLELAPSRLVQDAARVLRRAQRADGALGPRPIGDDDGTSDDRQVRWTLASLAALVEGLPSALLPPAA